MIAATAMAAFVTLQPSFASSVPAGKSQQLTSSDQVPDGLGKSDWQSIRAAHEAWKHEFRPVDGKWHAHNPGQQWTAKFDGHGFLTKPKDADWQWGLEFKSYGFGEQQTEVVGTPVVRIEGQRLSYQWNEAVQEWFVNDSRGLEHGFIITRRPSANGDLSSSGTPLSFTLGTRGTLRPTISSDALTVHFRDASNAPVLNYSGLKVWDADGKILASRFEAAGENQVRLQVEESGARYPLTIDPIAQQAYLKPVNNGGQTDDWFGTSVAVSGDTVVIGALWEDSSTTGVDSTPNENAIDSGAAYVFIRSGTTWSQQAYLKAGNCGAGDQFGISVAVSGDTVVVGAVGEGSSTTGVDSTPNELAGSSGAAYVFVRNGTAWNQQAYLKSSNTGVGDQFGISVAVSGDTVVVGALYEDSSTTGVGSTPNELASSAGAAYAFVRNGTAWNQQAYLKASNPGADDRFGYSVSVSGDTVVVGAPYEDSSTTGVGSTPNELASDAGAAYVFVRSGTTWNPGSYLKAGNTQAADLFGISVAVSVDTVVVGANNEDSSTTGVDSTPNELASSSGAAYVFVRNGTAWNQQAYLKASNTGAVDQFGRSVAVSGDTVVVGAVGEDSSTTGVDSTPNELAGSSGAAYVFVRNGTAWNQQAYLKAGNSGANDWFGNSVAVSGDTVIVGTPYEDSSTTGVGSTPNEGAINSGAAYVFTRSGAAWSHQAYFKASNTETRSGPANGDEFGASVAISGDTVIVGAPWEGSSSTGVDSIPNESGGNRGAAYIFVRNGTEWTQQAYLKSSTTNQNFGQSVAISGDTAVVGHLYDSSGPYDSSSSGAVYIYVRSGVVWSQQAYLKASNPQAGDAFGESVAVSGDTVAVTASGEDSSIGGVNTTPNESASDSGAAYVFVRSGSTWSQEAFLKASNPGSQDRFGRSIAVSGDTIVVGSSGEDSSTTGVNTTPNESAFDSGAAYVFVRSATEWSQQAYLKAGNTGREDGFGNRVAVYGDTVIIGAPGEDSSTTGINSSPNELASLAGAAYIFTRSNTIWSQQAYLKSSNCETLDRFGGSVAISENTVVVGATGEDSSTSGINSNPNEGASTSGAAYVFVRIGTTWSEQAYLKASNPGADDFFGNSVGISGETVVVGAFREDGRTAEGDSYPNELSLNSGAAYMFIGVAPPPAPVIVVSGNATPIVNGDSEPETADFTYFGTVASASGTITRIFTISNSGSVELNLSDTPNVALSGSHAGDFSVTLQPVSPVAAAGGSTTFTVTFDPSAIGLRTATVSMANDDPVNNPFTFSIQGTGLNSAPVITSNGGAAVASMNVAENSTNVTTVTAMDPDLPAQTLTYNITGGADAAKFIVDSSSGVLAFASAPNFESPADVGSNNVYDVTVTVTDNAAPNLSASQAISVTIANVNEAPSEITLSASSLAENVPANTSVGTLSSVDPDSGDSFTYSLVSGSGSSDNSAFTITGTSLQINSSPVVAAQSSYAIRVRSTDSGGLFFEKPFIITVTAGTPVFTAWATAAGLSGSAAAPDATPFNDGVPNLLKYAFNMNAGGPDVSVLAPGGSSGLPVISIDESELVPVLKVEFLRRKGSGLVYTPQRSATLDGFVAMTGAQTVTSIDSQWERVVVEETAPLVPSGSGFARVQVTLPP